MRETLETPDLFKSASLLCSGARLVKTRHEGRSVYFVLYGEHLSIDEFNYKRGSLRINPLEFRVHLNHLRDLIKAGPLKGAECCPNPNSNPNYHPDHLPN